MSSWQCVQRCANAAAAFLNTQLLAERSALLCCVGSTPTLPTPHPALPCSAKPTPTQPELLAPPLPDLNLGWSVCVCAPLQTWLELASSYVKSIDPNHLVYVGLTGIFGTSTPQL